MPREWRILVGVVAASIFVLVAGLLSHWFSSKDRGFANGVYYGLGRGLGQIAAFLLLPLLHVFFLDRAVLPISGWRGRREPRVSSMGMQGFGIWLQWHVCLEQGVGGWRID